MCHLVARTIAGGAPIGVAPHPLLVYKGIYAAPNLKPISICHHRPPLHLSTAHSAPALSCIPALPTVQFV